MFEIIVEPGVVKTWDCFKAENPKASIALDGYVEGESNTDLAGPYLNINHHEDVDRFITNSCCIQAKDLIKIGELNLFRKTPDSESEGQIYINDNDQDTSLTCTLLRHPELIESVRTPYYLKELLEVENQLDRTSGAYPFGVDETRMKRSYWVFAPYTNAKMKGLIPKMNASDMKEIVLEIEKRVLQLAAGKPKMINSDIRYENLKEGKGWMVIREIGPQARTYLFKEKNLNLIITATPVNGMTYYGVAKKGPAVDFSGHQFIEYLNNLEGRLITQENHWGGGGEKGLVWGSPRRTGSTLRPHEIAEILPKFMGPRFEQTLYMPRKQ